MESFSRLSVAGPGEGLGANSSDPLAAPAPSACSAAVLGSMAARWPTESRASAEAASGGVPARSESYLAARRPPQHKS
eukprot:scaffold76391_cov60-Phaeocystis_antarctica.AAC.2